MSDILADITGFGERGRIRGVPIALGFACILAVCFGVDDARSNFTAADFPQAAQLLPVMSARWWYLAAGAGLFLLVTIIAAGKSRPYLRRSHFVLSCLSSLILLWLVAVPDGVSPDLPRATTLILLLVAIVAPLTTLQKFSYRLGVPVALTSVAAVMILAGIYNTNRIRLLPPDATEAEPSIEKAV